MKLLGEEPREMVTNSRLRGEKKGSREASSYTYIHEEVNFIANRNRLTSRKFRIISFFFFGISLLFTFCILIRLSTFIDIVFFNPSISCPLIVLSAIIQLSYGFPVIDLSWLLFQNSYDHRCRTFPSHLHMLCYPRLRSYLFSIVFNPLIQ